MSNFLKEEIKLEITPLETYKLESYLITSFTYNSESDK